MKYDGLKKPSLDGRRLSKRPQITSLACLGALCLTSLTTGLTDVPLLGLGTTSIDSHPPCLHLACTAVSFAVGSILAAAFLDPATRASRISSLGLLVLASLMIASAHGILHVPFPQPYLSLAAAMVQFVIGMSNTIATVTIFSSVHPKGPMLGAAHAITALGVALRAATVQPSNDGSSEPSRAHERYAIPALALLTTTVLYLTSQRSKDPVAGPNHNNLTTAGTSNSNTKNNAGIQTQNPTRMKSPQYPPPPTRTTILAALLALLAFAATAAFPAWLLSTPADQPQPLDRDTNTTILTAAIWAGVCVARFLVVIERCLGTRFKRWTGQGGIPVPGLARGVEVETRSGTGTGTGTSQRRMGRLMTIACALAIMTGLVYFFLSTRTDGTRNLRLGTGFLAGCVLGPVYPCAVETALRDGDEDGKVSRVGIVVAFGNTGAVFGLLTGHVLVVACSGAHGVLSFVLAALVWGMLIVWRCLDSTATDPAP